MILTMKIQLTFYEIKAANILNLGRCIIYLVLIVFLCTHIIFVVYLAISMT